MLIVFEEPLLNESEKAQVLDLLRLIHEKSATAIAANPAQADYWLAWANRMASEVVNKVVMRARWSFVTFAGVGGILCGVVAEVCDDRSFWEKLFGVFSLILLVSAALNWPRKSHEVKGPFFRLADNPGESGGSEE